MDQYETMLHDIKIISEYNYLAYLRQKKRPQFAEETKNYVWKKTDFYYKLFFPDKKDLENSHVGDIGSTNDVSDVSDDMKNLYKKLVLICHPDKCQHDWAQKVFVMAGDAYKKNDSKTLEKLVSYWEEFKTFDNYLDMSIDKETEIKRWKSELWYQWYYDESMGKMLRRIFCDPKKILAGELKELEDLKKTKNELEKELNKLCDPMVCSKDYGKDIKKV